MNNMVVQTQKKLESVIEKQTQEVDRQPCLSDSQQSAADNQSRTSAPSVCSESSSLEIERSIQQILEEFPEYAEQTPEQKEIDPTPQTRILDRNEAGNADSMVEEPTPQCKEADTPFIQSRKRTKRHLDKTQNEEIILSDTDSAMTSEPTESRVSPEASDGSSNENRPTLKENLPNGLFSKVVNSPHPRKFNNTWDLNQSPRAANVQMLRPVQETDLSEEIKSSNTAER